LIAILAILVVIVAIAIPAYANIIENSKLKADISTASQIGRSAELYAMEHGLEDIDDILLNDEFIREYLSDIDPIPRQRGSFSVEVYGGKSNVTWQAPGATDIHNYYVNGQVRSYSVVKANPTDINF
jgi:Tfp pilus assembly major pilin PilA